MAWREDEARERFLQASMIFKELHGAAKLVDLLEQELHRELVIRKYADTSRVDIAARQSSRRLEIALNTLRFYADDEGYKVGNDHLSAVAKDKGWRARRALEVINGTFFVAYELRGQTEENE